ncbi:MAG: hypothetical protein COV44_06965 [Deltaproteobacteria bacterium CG11_big_fil_rev_8_21_14_0_20_45_16]|nr:MAG: hypothetical protein COV44_06965 [Deltaproteobacteria bacterium CG11_big_fil_rev_8_21_14_0_20_45_16]
MSLNDSAYIRRFFSVYSQEEKDKVRGHAFYPSDYLSALLPEDILHVQVVRSPHNGAEFSKIDRSRAEKHPGVVRVVTAKDIPNNIQIGGMGRDGQLILPEKHVRFKGEPVALIIAETLAAAKDAEKLLQIDWKKDSEQPPQVVEEVHVELGRVVPTASEERVSTEFKFPSLHARYLEPESGWVVYSGKTLNFHIGSLLSEAQRLWLASVLGLPVEAISAQEAYLGGQFGGRQQREMIAFLAISSWLCERSCCLSLEYQNQDIGSFGYSGRLEIAFEPRSGRLLELLGELSIDSGSYEGNAASYLKRALEHAACIYDFAHVQLHGKVLRTPSYPRRALKGEGLTAITWVTEQLIDQVAKKMEEPTLEFRIKSCRSNADASQRVLTEMDRVEKPFRLISADRTRPLWDVKEITGRGFAFQVFQSSKSQSIDSLEVSIELLVSGSFIIRTSNHTLDLHMKGALADVAASVLRTHPKAFTVVGEMRDKFDKARRRETYPEFYYLAQATWHAASGLRERIRSVAESLLRSKEVDLREGAVVDLATNRKMGFRELAFTSGAPQDLRASYLLADFDRPHACSAGAVSRVSFHPLTGELNVDSVKVVVDAGPVVRRTGLETEAENAVSWALAALFSSSLERDQPIPTSLDGPDEVTMIPLEYPLQTYSDKPPDYFGSRGVSDVLMSVVLASLVTAIQDAKDQTLKEIPMLSEFIYPKTLPQRVNMIPFRRPGS